MLHSPRAHFVMHRFQLLNRSQGEGSVGVAILYYSLCRCCLSTIPDPQWGQGGGMGGGGGGHCPEARERS